MLITSGSITYREETKRTERSYISRAPDIYLIVPLFRGMRSASDVRRTLNSRRTSLHQEIQCIQCIFIAREI